MHLRNPMFKLPAIIWESHPMIRARPQQSGRLGSITASSVTASMTLSSWLTSPQFAHLRRHTFCKVCKWADRHIRTGRTTLRPRRASDEARYCLPPDRAMRNVIGNCLQDAAK